MEIEKYARKPFEVQAVQVTLDNYEKVAEWCGGTPEMAPAKMMGTTTLLPCVRVPSENQAGDRGKLSAYLGNWVVELNGKFRVYKHDSFTKVFDKVKPPKKPATREHHLDMTI